MASLHHKRLRTRLAALPAAHPSTADLLLIRSALMWLCAAARPLRAHELRIALRVEPTTDPAHVARLLSDPARNDDDAAAVAALQPLLGDLVVFAAAEQETRPPAGDPPRAAAVVTVALADPELGAVLAGLAATTARSASSGGDDDDDADAALRALAFTLAQAHTVVAGVCISVCTASPPPPPQHAHDGATASAGLVRYAWRHWGAHLARSSASPLSDRDAARWFDALAGRVCADALAVLLAVGEVVAGPVTLPAAAGVDRVGAGLAVLRAQRALEGSVVVVAALLRSDVAGRGGLLVGEDAAGGGKDREKVAAPSRTALAWRGLPMDPHLGTTQYSSSDTGRSEVPGFAEAARGLRSLCVALSGAPLYGALLEKCDGDRSPTDRLVHLADWMETAASSPYWETLAAGSTPKDAFRIPDLDGPSASIPSPLRLRAAAVLDKLQTLLRTLVGESTYTLNDDRYLSRPTSAFAHIPSHLHGTGDPLGPLSALAPHSLSQFARRLAHRTLPPPLNDLDASTFTDGMASRWPQVKAAVLADGYRWAAVYLALAILTNHVRRMLTPWLAAYQHHTPIEDLRLVLSRADLFLDAALALSWPHVLAMHLQKLACDAAAALALHLLLSAHNAPAPSSPATLSPRLLSAARLVYLVWVLSCAEYALDRTANTTAFALAAWRLLARGSPAAHRVALARILRARWPMVPVALWQLQRYATRGLAPTVRAAVAAAASGRPGLLAALGATAAAVWAVLRFRTRLYICIEMGGLFVVLGAALVAAGWLVAEFFDDPLGLRVSTARVRRVMEAARRVLAEGDKREGRGSEGKAGASDRTDEEGKEESGSKEDG